MFGPQTALADDTHKTKYREPEETFEHAMKRIAHGLADTEKHETAFYDILANQRFMPGGRVQAAIGAQRKTTAYNCFVSGTIPDSFVARDNAEDSSIMHRAEQAAATMRLGGGIGYDFSTLRPSGAMIEKLRSNSKGPLGFMRIFNEIGLVTASAGHRRGAQMGVLRIDHPDILEFIRMKQDNGTMTGFNISVGVTDQFMMHLQSGTPFPLTFGEKVYAHVDPRELWDELMRATWDWAEPGVLFIDQINRMNNLRYCEYIAATNPCGEQPLPPFGACLLGSFNLTKYLWRPAGKDPTFLFRLFEQDIEHVVRAMDNVVDRTIYPLLEQEHEAKQKRRMGLGVAGLANALEAMGMSYGSAEFVRFTAMILATLRDRCYLASAALAQEKGSFPMFDSEQYMQSEFVKTLPVAVQAAVAKGIRNSHLLSIAPTGTISMCADNISSGIEPVFAYKTVRPMNTPEGPITLELEDYGVRVLKTYGKVCDDVTVDEHLAVLTVAQRYVDSAVSKTCNVPSSTSFEDFKLIYQRAWSAGCKGVTTFRLDGKRFGLLSAAPSQGGQAAEEEGSSCQIDPQTGRRECS